VKKFALGINEAARATGTNAKTIADAIADGKLIARELDGKPVISRCALRAWIKNLPAWYPTTSSAGDVSQ